MQSPLPRNPFVPISSTWRGVLIAYVLLYHVVTPGLHEILYNSSAPLSGTRVILGIVTQLLVYLPLFFYRPKRYGWLHPLLFPTFFGLAKSLVKDPGQLLTPLAVMSGPPQETLLNPEVPQFGLETMALAAVEHQVYAIVGLLCYYAGFFFAERYTNFDFKPARLKISKPRYVAIVAVIVVGCAFIVFLTYVQQHGGLSTYMLSYFGGGRHSWEGELSGTIFFVVGMGVIACLLWYALKPDAVKNPMFWAAFALIVPVEFFLTGSRSSIFVTVSLFIIIWMIRNQKVPQGKVVALGIAAVVMIGVLGQFRNSSFDGRMNWDMFSSISLKEAVEATYAEIESRHSISGGVPIVASVPEEVDFLYGKTYVGTVLFFVPRFIWEEKPRSAGYYNSRLILARGGGGAVPTGAIAEAYWNFALPGVIIVYFLFGMFRKGMVRMMRRYSYAPVIWVIYVLALTTLSPSSLSVTGIRDILGATGIAVLMGALVFRRGRR